MAYEKDICPYFKFSLEDGIINPWEWYMNDKCNMENCTITLGSEGAIWGPYFKLNKGSYTAYIKGENISKVEADVYSNTNGGIIRESTPLEDDGSISFELTDDIEDFELRIYNKSNEDVTITCAEIK